jgi:hypothetical protein
MSDKKSKLPPDLAALIGNRKPLRNLKVKLAERDHEVYRIGFAVGGTRLSSREDDPKKEEEK